MIKINELYDLVNDLIDKNNGRFIEKDEFSRYVNLSSLELFDECIGATNKRLDNKTMVSYGKSQNTDKRLEPFRTGSVLTVVDGEVNLPEDCEKITAVLTSKRTPKALIRIDEDRVGVILDNPLREPTEDEVYYLEGMGNLQIFGLVNTIYVTYLKTPTTAVYATKEVEIEVGNRKVTREVYDEDKSVDLNWGARQTLDIANRVLAKVGVPMKDNFVEQMVNVNKNNE